MGVPHHEHVGPHGVQGLRRVEQGLALLDRGAGDGKGDRVHAQPLAGDLERHQCPRRGLEEEIDLGETRKRPCAAAGVHGIGIALGAVEKKADLRRRQPLDAEQMAVGERIAVRSRVSGRRRARIRCAPVLGGALFFRHASEAYKSPRAGRQGRG